MADLPPIQFAQARGGRIAYQVWGEGPPVLGIPPLAQNIELAWERPEIRALLDRLGSFSRYVHFDKRGTGASDRTGHIPDIDERVDDVRAVMDAAGMEQAHLFAQSEGGPMTILFAATYPERALSLVLLGSGATTFPPDMEPEEVEMHREGARRVAPLWGTPESPMIDRFAPSLAANQDFRDWWQRYERAAAGADTLMELHEMSLHMDVRDVLPEITVPTLVLHRVGDHAVSVERGREVAAGISGAKLVELPGEDHYAFAGDIEAWASEMERFVTGTVSAPPAPSPRPGVRIVTLGRFAVERDGEEVETSEWGSRLARQLLKRLVAARGWPVTRDELIDLLWPDESDMRKLGARLSVQLSAVRRVLGGGIIADRDSVRLDLEEVSTDLEDLYRATAPGAVVAAYAGEFLPEDVYEDWTISTRDEARSLFMGAAREYAEMRLDLGSSSGALEASKLARRMVDADPYSGDGHRLLVRSLVAAGQVSEAEHAYDRWAEAAAEIGADIPAFDAV